MNWTLQILQVALLCWKLQVCGRILHWLAVHQRITYKLAVLTYKVLSTFIPSYLRDKITEHVYSWTPRLSAAGPVVHHDRLFQIDVISGFRHRLSGTRCHIQFSSATLCLFSNRDVKLFYLPGLSLNIDLTCRCSASEVTTTWSYTNAIIVITIIIIIACKRFV